MSHTYRPGADVDCSELPADALLVVFRLVTTDDRPAPELLECFRSNEAKGKPPRGRERSLPSLRRGLSVYASQAQAIDRQRRIVAALRPGEVPRIGSFVARVELRGPGIWHTAAAVDGHLTIWASPSTCIAAIADIEPIR